MIKIYTCYNCAFPFKADEQKVPPKCPACGAPPDQFLSEPFRGDISKRRIHVDPPEPDPNWDPMNTAFHVPKRFPARSRHGRLRRFVFEYADAAKIREFYAELFDWDIIEVDRTVPDKPLMYCATGPGTANWEPRVVSFIYGFLMPQEADRTGKRPMFLVEVQHLGDAIKLVEMNGGKTLRGEYAVADMKLAVVEDTEGNALYLWETPPTVTWNEPESQTYP